MKTTYQAGKWLSICDVCGLKHYNTDLQKDWRGLMVCLKDYESRHPQDLIRVRGDNPAVAWVRPEPEDEFIYPIQCTLEGNQGLAGVGVAGCMIAGFRTPY